MENIVKNRLESVRFGTAQTYKNLTILPLVAPADGAFEYRTLSEALANWELAISEVSAAGSVPELLVVNRARQAVLLIDGEELKGAKQNRVLNTSILLKEVSETKIPVSCTEQGRWSYASKMFSASGNVMAYKSRSKKARSVHEFLEACGAPRSDQGEVWEEISLLQAKAQAPSPTSAMSDVYKAREDDLRQCEERFPLVPNQVGLFALIDGEPAGMELVSLARAYGQLHSKLVRSYALDALLEQDNGAAPATPPAQGQGAGAGPGHTPAPAALSAAEPSAAAKAFLETILGAEEQQFPSIGHGTEFRYRLGRTHRGQGGARPGATERAFRHSIAGSALVHQNEVIHAAFFRLDDTESAERMTPYRHRRRWRVE